MVEEDLPKVHRKPTVPRMKEPAVPRVCTDRTDVVDSQQELPLPFLQAKYYRSINSSPPLQESMK